MRGIDLLNEKIGRAVSWLSFAIVVTAFTVAMLRYLFNIGWVWMQESYVWMHGIVFMVAAGYTLLHDGHVRVDILYRGASERFKAWVDLLGSLFLLLPGLAIVWYAAYPYVLTSWIRLEQSREAGGLPGIFLLKTCMLIFCALTALQGIALAVRSIMVLTGQRKTLREDESEGVL
jgi:TRAP-type mannitol/chloroaromatic compound transport system permease small subunit